MLIEISVDNRAAHMSAGGVLDHSDDREVRKFALGVGGKLNQRYFECAEGLQAIKDMSQVRGSQFLFDK